VSRVVFFAIALIIALVAADDRLFSQDGMGAGTGVRSNGRYVEGTARIVLEDGSSLRTTPLIMTECPTADPNCKCETQFFLGGTLVFRATNTPSSPGSCFISVRLAGYQTVKTYIHDGTVIKLYRVGPNEDVSVSAASLPVPAEARKHYESGESAAARGKWPQAEAQLHAALAIDPNYAMALSELGRVLRQQNRLGDAIEALNKARDADPQYVKPVVQLAEVAGIQQRWEDEMRLSQQALKMRPAGTAPTYYYYAQAAFNLGMTEEAEKLSREAVAADGAGECPESMVLLGEIFEKQGNASDAVVEYKAYLKMAPHGPGAQHAKEALVRIRRPG
jgi:cytochrome c-type biogenesis protein CcmH/NrfG